MSTRSFDFAEALAQAGSEQLMRELAAILLEEGSKEIGAVRAAHQRRDASALEAAAHRFKGAVIIFGARPLGAVLEEVEQSARRAMLADCEPLVARAEFEWQELAGDLQAWLTRSPQASPA